MNLHALLEAVPADNAGAGERQIAEMAAEADSYDDAYTQLLFQVSAGWRLVNVRRDSYGPPIDQYGRAVK